MLDTTSYTDINSFDMSQYGATYLHSSGINFLNIKNTMIGGTPEFIEEITKYMVKIVQSRIDHLKKIEQIYIQNSRIFELKIDGKEIGPDRIEVMRALNRLYKDAIYNMGLMEDTKNPPLIHLTNRLKYEITKMNVKQGEIDYINKYHEQVMKLVEIFDQYASRPVDAGGSLMYESAVQQVRAIDSTIQQIIKKAVGKVPDAPGRINLNIVKELDDSLRKITYQDIFKTAFENNFDPQIIPGLVVSKYARDILIGHLREGDFVEFENRIDNLLGFKGKRKRIVAGDIVETPVFRIDSTSDGYDAGDRIIYYGAAIKSYSHIVTGDYMNHSFLPSLKNYDNGIYQQWMYLLNNTEALSLVNMNYSKTRESVEKIRKQVIQAEAKMSQIFNFVGFLDSFLDYDGTTWKFIPELENKNRLRYIEAKGKKINLIKIADDPKKSLSEYYSIFYVMGDKIYWTSDLLQTALNMNSSWLPIKELKEDHKYKGEVFAAKSDVNTDYLLSSDKLTFLLEQKQKLLADSDDYATAYAKLSGLFQDILSKDIVHVSRNYFSIDVSTFRVPY